MLARVVRTYWLCCGSLVYPHFSRKSTLNLSAIAPNNLVNLVVSPIYVPDRTNCLVRWKYSNATRNVNQSRTNQALLGGRTLSILVSRAGGEVVWDWTIDEVWYWLYLPYSVFVLDAYVKHVCWNGSKRICQARRRVAVEVRHAKNVGYSPIVSTFLDMHVGGDIFVIWFHDGVAVSYLHHAKTACCDTGIHLERNKPGVRERLVFSVLLLFWRIFFSTIRSSIWFRFLFFGWNKLNILEIFPIRSRNILFCIVLQNNLRLYGVVLDWIVDAHVRSHIIEESWHDPYWRAWLRVHYSSGNEVSVLVNLKLYLHPSILSNPCVVFCDLLFLRILRSLLLSRLLPIVILVRGILTGPVQFVNFRPW